MDFTLDLSFLADYADQHPLLIAWDLFISGGWILVVAVLIWGFWQIYGYQAGGRFAMKQKYAFLAIDVPKENLTTPLAVENIFSQFAGAHGSLTWWESNIEGAFQLGISLEIVSIEGYIQYLIRTPEKFRDTVEAAIYAQYPDAEITEVEDYTKEAPDHFPNEEWDMFGTELKQVTHEVYPIKTWREFEDRLTGDFIDPLAALLETISRVGPGEQVWYQIILTPISDSWKAGAQAEIDKILGRKPKSKKNLFDYVLAIPTGIIQGIGDAILGPSAPTEEKDMRTSMMELTPGQKGKIEAIEMKTSKIGFKTKIRFVYLAKHEVMKKSKIANPFIGAIKQYNTANLNAIKPAMRETATRANYFFKKSRVARRQNRLMAAFKGRSQARGALGTGEGAIKGSVYNIEELATLWHFPGPNVKVPLVKKTESKRAEPPTGLPIGTEIDAGDIPITQEEVPSDIPESPQDSFTFDFTDKGFEKRFAKNKELFEREEKQQSQQGEKQNEETADESSEDTPENLPFV